MSDHEKELLHPVSPEAGACEGKRREEGEEEEEGRKPIRRRAPEEPTKQ